MVDVNQEGVPPTWTIWGGNTADSPHWAICLSAYAPAALIQDVTFELAHDPGRGQPTHTAATAPSLPMKAAAARPSASAPRAAPKR